MLFNSTKILLYIGHPFDLAYFIRLIPLLNKEKNLQVTSIVACGKYFRKFKQLKNLLAQFSDVSIIVSENLIPAYQRNIFKVARNTLYLRKLIRDIDKDATILISIDKSTFMANYLNSHFKKVILIQTVDDHNIDLKNNYKIGLFLMFHFNLINILTGSKRIKLRYHRGSKGQVVHHEVIDNDFKIVYRNDKQYLDNRIVLPPVASEKKSKKILIFGSRYNGWKYMEPNVSHNKNIIFSVYKHINSVFSEYTIYYKPHPKEQGTEFGELQEIFNGRLIDVGIALNSELFLLTHPNIEYCFSLNSTSSMSAYEMGFSSKVFYNLLRFPKSLKMTMNNVFQDAPDEFFIKNQEDDIKEYCIKKGMSPYLDYIQSTIENLANL
jgi:hypothetical protein